MKKAKIEHLELWVALKTEEDEEKKSKIRHKLVEIYFPLVKKISYTMAKKLEWKVAPEELASSGVDGLYIAIDRFDYKRGVPFTSYAGRRISGSMIDEIRREDLVPRSVRINYNRIEKIREKLESIKGKKIEESDIIKHADIDPVDFIRNTKKYIPASFSSIDGSDIQDPSKQEDFKQDSNNVLVDCDLSSLDSKILRLEFLSKLVGKNFSILEQQIIYMYYYLDFTMDMISKKLDMSESRISQIHTDVLTRLKDKVSRNPKYFDETIFSCITNCKDAGPLF